MPDSSLFLILALSYGTLIFAAAWLISPLPWRQRWERSTSQLAHRLWSAFSQRKNAASETSERIFGQASRLAGTTAETIFARKRQIALALMMLFLPILIVLIVKPQPLLHPYDDSPEQQNLVAATLLRGEQLVPPPPLPPEVFVAKEVEAVRQALSGASREWLALDADFRQRLLVVFQLMAQKGYQMVLIEGYRSPERQTYLATLGPQITNAGAYQSYHQFGLAGDCAFYRNGRLIISEKDPWAMEGYRLYGSLAESVGLTWGGRWKLMDFGHVELRQSSRQAYKK